MDDFRRTVSEYAALNAVGRALLGTLELDAVLGMSVNEAAALVGGDAAVVLLLEPDIDSAEIAAATTSLRACNRTHVQRQGLIARLLHVGAEGALFSDLLEPLRCGMAEVRFPRAVSVPLRVRDETYGALVAFATGDRAPFDSRDRDMLSKLATFAAIAIDNARLFREEEHQIRQLKTLSALAGEMAQLRSASELFPSAVRIIHHEFGFEHVSILLLDEARQELVLEAVAPDPDLEPGYEYVRGYRQSIETGILGHVARTGEPYLAQDTRRDGLFHKTETWGHARSELVLPIRLKERVAGVLNLETRIPYAFQETDLDVMLALANLIGVGLENARLVDDARQAERQRLQAEKLATIGQLVAGLAHEINNPLAAAQSAAELMLGQELSDDMRESLEVIRAESARAALIVRKLLDFSRPHETEYQPTDVIDAIEAALSLRVYEHRVHNITVIRKFAPLPPVRADMHRLQQVFLNLIVNAEHAMAGQARPRVIEIESSDPDEMIEICITDSGPGIDDFNLDLIFDPFFTTKPVGQGTGLGLSVSFGIIRELGGSIKAVSHRDGARFVIRLPAVRSDSPLPEPVAPPSPQEEPAAGPPISVLFVDDEPSLRRVAQRYLARMGHHVELAANGEEALQLLQTRRFDVIVTDLRMPGMGGEELYKRIGNYRVPMQHRFLFMSGDIVNETTRRFLAATGRPYLHKPFELKRLGALIRTIADEPDI